MVVSYPKVGKTVKKRVGRAECLTHTSEPLRHLCGFQIGICRLKSET